MAKVKTYGKAAMFTDNVPIDVNSKEDLQGWLGLAEDCMCTNNVAVHAFLMGEILTLVEIAIPPGQQLKSLKDQIKASFNRSREEHSTEIHYVFSQLAAGFGVDLETNSEITGSYVTEIMKPLDEENIVD